MRNDENAAMKNPDTGEVLAFGGFSLDASRLPAFEDSLRNAGIVDYWRASGNWGEFCPPVGADDFECT